MFWYYLGIICLIICPCLWWIYCRFRFYFSKVEFNLTVNFEAYSYLASWSYQNPGQFWNGYRVERGPFSFQLIDLFDGGRIWLWKQSSKDSKKIRHIVVIRGSQHIHELSMDWDLVKSVAADDITSFSESITLVHEQLVDGLRRNDVQGPLIFVGHSLGASIAEVLYFKHRASCPDVSRRAELMAYTFDSPGQSQSYRASIGMPNILPGLYTLNSIMNPINMLSKPCAEHLFSCGSGSRIRLILLQSLASLIFTAPLQFLLGNLQTHPIDTLRKYISSGEFVRDNPQTWPLLSGRALETAWQIFQSVFNSRPEPMLPTWLVQDIPGNIDVKKDYPDLPRIESWRIKIPYPIKDLDQWKTFCSMVESEDIIIPFFGYTGVGKSETINHLLNIQDKNYLVPVGGGVNSSQVPYVSLYNENSTPKKRWFLVDVPGVGGGTSGKEDTPFIQNLISGLLNQIKGKIGCAVVILRGPIRLSDETYVDELKKTGLTILYCNNCDQKRPEDIQQRLAHIRGKFGDGISLVHYDAFEDIGPLEKALESFITNNECKIKDNIIKRAYIDSQIDEKKWIKEVWTAVGGTSWVTLSSAYLATLPGTVTVATTLGPWAATVIGHYTVFGGGAILLGPSVIVGGIGIAALAFLWPKSNKKNSSFSKLHIEKKT